MKAKFFLLATASVAYMMSSGFCGATPPAEGGAAAQEESGAAAAAAAEPADKDQPSDSGVRKPNLEEKRAEFLNAIAAGEEISILRLPFFPTEELVKSLNLNSSNNIKALILPEGSLNKDEEKGFLELLKFFPNIIKIAPKYINEKILLIIKRSETLNLRMI